jgi:hypothetical protein
VNWCYQIPRRWSLGKIYRVKHQRGGWELQVSRNSVLVLHMNVFFPLCVPDVLSKLLCLFRRSLRASHWLTPYSQTRFSYARLADAGAVPRSSSSGSIVLHQTDTLTTQVYAQVSDRMRRVRSFVARSRIGAKDFLH